MLGKPKENLVSLKRRSRSGGDERGKRSLPSTGFAPVVLELYSHETQSVIDSCCRYDIDEAVQAAEHLVSIARQLDEE